MSEPTPTRVQRRRAKGWRMPANTIYVGRPTKWGNNFVVGKNGTALAAVHHYRKHMAAAAVKALAQRELRGKNLACFCRLDQPCHADVLLEIANA